VTFVNETASGWQLQLLDVPVLLVDLADYVVAVNYNGGAGSAFAYTPNAPAVDNGFCMPTRRGL
jgi:hypothetical protein